MASWRAIRTGIGRIVRRNLAVVKPEIRTVKKYPTKIVVIS